MKRLLCQTSAVMTHSIQKICNLFQYSEYFLLINLYIWMLTVPFWHTIWCVIARTSTSLLVTAQHSEPYRKMGRMQVLYSFSLVEMEIVDFQIWLSRLCIAARVMALRCGIWRELWNDTIRKKSLTWTQKLSDQLNLAHLARKNEKEETKTNNASAHLIQYRSKESVRKE